MTAKERFECPLPFFIGHSHWTRIGFLEDAGRKDVTACFYTIAIFWGACLWIGFQFCCDFSEKDFSLENLRRRRWQGWLLLAVKTKIFRDNELSIWQVGLAGVDSYCGAVHFRSVPSNWNATEIVDRKICEISNYRKIILTYIILVKIQLFNILQINCGRLRLEHCMDSKINPWVTISYRDES